MSKDATTQEPLLTRFFVFEISEDKKTLTYKGQQDARDRDHAGRLFFGEPDEREFNWVAVSENAYKPKRRKPKVVTTATNDEIEMPDLRQADEVTNKVADPPAAEDDAGAKTPEGLQEAITV